jgi:porphobilinogen synthase
MYPTIRLRRNRKHQWLRDLVSETTILPQHLIYPIFVTEGRGVREEVNTTPGIYRVSIDVMVEEARKATSLGIKAIALFPVVPQNIKNESADEAYNLDNLICRSIRSIKNAGIEIGVICDVALDPYTSHGHDGIFIDGDVDNDASVEALCNQALVLAKAGADIVAPSDMMDGRVGAIREFLDDEGFENIGILAYAAKYSSSFYGPYRDAIGSASSLGKSNKSTYHMDKRNSLEAMREIEFDINEGADMVMIKPGMAYLDIVYAAAQNFDVPVFAYQVTGEYAMLRHGANAGCFKFEDAMMESLIAFRRAGATAIFTYAAIEVAEKLKRL